MRKFAMITLCSLALGNLPVLAPQLTGSVLLAQQGSSSKKQETRKVPAMRERTYKTIAEAQALIEAEQAAP